MVNVQSERQTEEMEDSQILKCLKSLSVNGWGRGAAEVEELQRRAKS